MCFTSLRFHSVLRGFVQQVNGLLLLRWHNSLTRAERNKRDGDPYRSTILFVPRSSLRDFRVLEMHAGGFAGNLGAQCPYGLSIAIVEDRFDWPCLKQDVARIEIAKTRKHNTGLYTPLPILHSPWQDWSFYFVPAPRHDSILVVVDRLPTFSPCNKTLTHC